MPTDADLQRAIEWLGQVPFLDAESTIPGSGRAARMNYQDWLAAGRALPNLEPALRVLLRRRSARVELPQVAYALGWVGNRATGPVLLGALNSPERQLRREAAAALGRLRDGRAVPGLCELARDDPDPNVRANACVALGKIGSPTALPTLDVASQDKHPFVAEVAAEARDRIVHHGER